MDFKAQEKNVFTHIEEMLRAQSDDCPTATAFEALGKPALTYRSLFDHFKLTKARLREMGIGCNDVVAIVLPNGPEMALAFLCVAGCAISAPLNPNYREAEFEFYLSDLNAKALVLQAGMVSAARSVAEARGIPIIDLVPRIDSPAGVFELQAAAEMHAVRPDASETIGPDSTALILHTSGTTSRPKMVPLSQGNLCTSAEHIRQTLLLTVQDRCLNVMPLFHIHGLLVGVLATLTAGASVVCTPGFYAPHFFEWIEDTRPTWYSAVPTMHQAVLIRAAEHADIIARCQLRFIRSSSSSLPPQVMAELERVFQVPVIEAYGMTEASHQMASNPLPPLPRKAGSVGLAAGPQVAVMAEDSSVLLPRETVGELVVRGPNITAGYLNNHEANANSFADRWFRTGDQGYMDADGYIFITGRLKELINRGGEKITPREIDEVLLDHPAVAQAVAFSIPDPTLGEDLAAAVVLRDQQVTELQLREFAATRLADFKVPRRIVILDEIPKGPTGKLQRIGLAKQLGLDVAAAPNPVDVPYVAPRTATEMELAGLWEKVLGRPQIGVHQRFRDVGGDSMLALLLLTHVSRQFQLEITTVSFFERPTIADQAAMIMQLQGGNK